MTQAVAHLDFLAPGAVFEAATDRPVSVLARKWMHSALDELSLKFVIASRTARQPVLDFGCGDGLATAAALARGAQVVAVDPDRQSIEQLLARIPSQYHRRLRARVGRLADFEFKGAHFGAVHASRVLQELDGEHLERTLQRFLRWLYPEGRLYLSVLTPDGPFWSPLGEQIVQKGRDGERWPGYIVDVSHFTGERGDARPVHLLDEYTLRRELDLAGFVIEELRSHPLAWESSQVCCSVIARCGP